MLSQFPTSLERFTTSVLESLHTDASLTAKFFSWEVTVLSMAFGVAALPGCSFARILNPMLSC